MKVHFGQNDWNEAQTGVKTYTPEIMWTIPKNWQVTEVRFVTEVNFQTGLSSLQVSCKQA